MHYKITIQHHLGLFSTHKIPKSGRYTHIKASSFYQKLDKLGSKKAQAQMLMKSDRNFEGS